MIYAYSIGLLGELLQMRSQIIVIEHRESKLGSCIVKWYTS